jgi:N-methylhydantoinase A
MRYTVPGRIDANGNELLPLDRKEIEKVVRKVAIAEYESVAIGLIHSYANNSHEKLVQEVVNDLMPKAMVSLSSEVSPQMREYERFNTVVANAYIKPLMKSYLDRLKGKMKEAGADCNIFLMHSGGGIISIESAANFPVRLVESGPAGGAVFAANIAEKYGLDKVLSFDMGGTTAKICLIKNYTPRTSRVFEVARTYRFKKGSGMPISIPVIDMVEIGAGGGSLAHVDEMKQIRVGPESAGSEPGPACYNKGGNKPAVTDADLVLGKLDPENFAGGSIKLNTSSSKEVLQNVIGNSLETDAVTSAFGLVEVVDENMANAARVHAVENGEDLSQYTMIAFGGAAPLHAGRLCEKLGVDRLLVPQGAGVGSAIGFLRAPFSFEANRSVYMSLASFHEQKIKDIFSELQLEATKFVRDCDPKSEILSDFKVYMRYSGQGWEIPIVLTKDQAFMPDVDTFESRFIEDYIKLFGRAVEGMDIEITVWSVNASTPHEEVNSLSENTQTKKTPSHSKRKLFDHETEDFKIVDVVLRNSMSVGSTVDGPAIITEDETTVIVPANRKAISQSDGSIEMRLKVIQE